MTGPVLRSTLDGLPIRPSGEWAREKLYYLQKYMTIFNGGMRYHLRRYQPQIRRSKWPALSGTPS